MFSGEKRGSCASGQRLLLVAAFSAMAFLLPALSVSALDYVANLQVSAEKSLYGPNEEIHISGALLLTNITPNQTLAVANATINLTISNSSGLQAQYPLNTSSDGSFKTKSDLFPEGIQANAPAAEGYYNITVRYLDPNGMAWNTGLTVRVFSRTIDYISISPAKARYYASETVSMKLKALKEVGDKKVAMANVTANGTMRHTNRTTIATFSCVTATDGVCTTSVTAPASVGTYLLETNNFLSTSSFVVVPFEAFVYVKDSTGSSFKETFKANEQATIEVNVKANGTLPTGEFVFNGTITDSSSRVVANITSTTLDSNNSYSNRFAFIISNSFTNGVYYVSVTVYRTVGGTGRASASTTFQARSWNLIVTKASKNAGFDYEYTSFPGRNVSFEVFPKENQNGTLITGLNSSQFNITLNSKTGTVLAVGNATWNTSCSSSGCYTFQLQMPSAVGSYVLAVSLNYSSEVQTVHRIVSVTSTSLSATPANQEGQMKELFSTTEPVYISIAAKNTTSDINISDILVESVVYENGTKFSFTEVASWSNVSSNNSALEWAWNGSAQRLKLDAPKVGGNYMISVFANNRSAAASTKFTVNPYTVCGVAKSTAGTVDSSSSFYVWQYKTTDTIYLELKISQAKNSLGRASAENSTFSTAYYGMGSACYIDTTKTQAITNATITVESVVNMQSGTKIAINTTASTCSADDNSGTYTCTVKPETKWDGGRYAAKLKVTGQDSETIDRAEGMFEAKAFYLWAWSSSWTNKPVSNITFSVQMYEAGTNWWSNYGSTGGITGEVSIQKVEYNGKDGEWLWPPIDLGYNTTGLNSSNITNGRGSFTLETPRLPKGRWEPGYYVATVKGTNTATGESDYGQAWFGIRQWETYSTPVEALGGSYRWKDSFGTRENITLFVRITNAGDWNDNGGTSLAAGGNVSIGVKKLQFYTSWPPTELNSTAYTANTINVSTSSPWYSSANPSSHSRYMLNITPTSGRWNSGYYNIVLDVNGTETGYGWFNVLAFSVDTQPVNSTGSYLYTSKGNMPAYFNITTTKNRKSSYSYYSSNDYINTTVKDVALNVWREDTWTSEALNYPEDLNISPMQANGTALIMVNKTGNWPPGYYWGEITMQDSENSTAIGYLWFSVRSFRVDTSVNSYNVDTDSNVSVSLNTREPDWSNNNIIRGNYTITQIYEDAWGMSGRSRTSYASYAPSSSEWFNATTTLNITPNSGSWSSSNNGYHYLTVAVRDNNDNTTQNGWVSFRAVPFSATIGSVQNSYSTSQSSDITVPVTVRTAISNTATAANLTRAFEWTWPTQTEYGFAVGNCTSAANGTACQVNGTQNVTLIMPSGGWPSGWHYINLEFVSANGANKITADNNAWFNAVQAYDGSFSNVDEGGVYKYNFGFNENITIKLSTYNSNYAPQRVNITKVEMSEDGDSCWSEYCRTYTSYIYNVLNGSGGNEIKGNGTIRILNNATWMRGQHSIKATIRGPSGTAVIKTGYVNVRDTSAPNATIVSPQNGALMNTSTFLVNLSANEDVYCNVVLWNYDSFSQGYCSGGNISSSACNDTRFNGSTYYYRGISDSTTQKVHANTVSTAGMPNQDYNIYARCFDVDWNPVEAYASFKVNLSQHSQVSVNLSSPANSAIVNTSSITFIHNVTGPAASSVNCAIYLNLSSMWVANASRNVTFGNSTNITASNITASGFNNGTYLWNTYCYQTNNVTNAASAAANWTFTVTNITSPVSLINVNLASPANGSTANTSTANYTYNFTGAAQATCSLYTNTTGAWVLNQTDNNAIYAGMNFTNTNLQNGNYIWNVYCVNSTNPAYTDWGNSNFTFTVVNNATSVPVAVNLSAPASNARFNGSSVTFIYNVTGAAASSANCSIYLNVSNVWRANASRVVNLSTPGVTAANATITNFNNGTYLWNTYCYHTNNASNNAWAAANWTLNITTNSTPTISLTLLAPESGSTVNTSSLNYSYFITATAITSSNCSLYTNSTGAWHQNQTNSNISAGNKSFLGTNVRIGYQTWNVNCMSAADSNVSAWAVDNWSVNAAGNLTNSTIAINLSSPANASTISVASIMPNFAYNITGPSLLNCTLWGNFTGAWLANTTNNSVSPGRIGSATVNVSAGYYSWNAKCVDATDSTSYAWANHNWTFNANSS